MSMELRPGAETRKEIVTFDDGVATRRADTVATEEPLEIRISLAGRSKSVAVTMRTPGADFELAVGFLFGEGVISRREQVTHISYCRDTDLPPEQLYNIVIVELDPSSEPDLRSLDRHFYTSSACGVCGKANLEAMALRISAPLPAGPEVTTEVLAGLPGALREAQGVFSTTGGLHSAGLFEPDGALVASREDVGRHNALDKVIGWAFLAGRVPLAGHLVMVSGRSSYELAQKCVTAGAPILCSVSAPSSLAVDVAQAFGMTLVGFLRDERMNVYAGAERITS